MTNEIKLPTLIDLAYRVNLPLFGVPEPTPFGVIGYRIEGANAFALFATVGAFKGFGTGTIMGLLLA